MKQFKIIDFWVSVGLIVSYLIIYILEPKTSIIKNAFLIQGYFIIGLWQLISMITHFLNRKVFYLSPMRIMYNWLIIICITTMPMGLLVPTILLFATPLMAIFYTGICGFEVFAAVKNLLVN